MGLALAAGLAVVAGGAAAYSADQQSSAAASAAQDQENLLLGERFSLENIAKGIDLEGVNIDPNTFIQTILNPLIGNPSLSGSTLQGQLLTGGPIEGILQQSGPLQQVQNQLNSMGLTRKQIKRAMKQLSGKGKNAEKRAEAGKDPKVSNALAQALRTLGFGDLEGFQAAETEFAENVARIESELGPIADAVRQDRSDALLGLGQVNEQILGLSEGATEFAESFDPTSITDLESRLLVEMLRDIDEREEETLARAQATGINPAAQLGDLEDLRADARNEDALVRALNLTAGETGIASQRFGVGTQTNLAATQALLNFLGIGNEQVNNAGILANNSFAQTSANANNFANRVNQALVEAEFFNANTANQEELIRAQLMADALGIGRAGGLAGIEGQAIESAATANTVNAGIQTGIGTFSSLYGGGFGSGGSFGSGGGGAPAAQGGGAPLVQGGPSSYTNANTGGFNQDLWGGSF